jgi:hypothetical protein
MVPAKHSRPTGTTSLILIWYSRNSWATVGLSELSTSAQHSDNSPKGQLKCGGQLRRHGGGADKILRGRLGRRLRATGSLCETHHQHRRVARVVWKCTRGVGEEGLGAARRESARHPLRVRLVAGDFHGLDGDGEDGEEQHVERKCGSEAPEGEHDVLASA